MRFYDKARSGNLGTVTDPFLSDLRACPIHLQTYCASNAKLTVDYSNEVVCFFSFQTDSAWANGFDSQIDGFVVTLKKGGIGAGTGHLGADGCRPSRVVIGSAPSALSETLICRFLIRRPV